jgi:hypothetical protein
MGERACSCPPLLEMSVDRYQITPRLHLEKSSNSATTVHDSRFRHSSCPPCSTHDARKPVNSRPKRHRSDWQYTGPTLIRRRAGAGTMSRSEARPRGGNHPTSTKNASTTRTLLPKIRCDERLQSVHRATLCSAKARDQIMGLSLLHHFRVTSEEQGMLRELLLFPVEPDVRRGWNESPACLRTGAAQEDTLKTGVIAGFAVKYRANDEE